MLSYLIRMAELLYGQHHRGDTRDVARNDDSTRQGSASYKQVISPSFSVNFSQNFNPLLNILFY